MITESRCRNIIGYSLPLPTISYVSFYEKVLLWQTSIATSPHNFVIATCIWSDLIIYLLVSCNKQLSSTPIGARHLSRPYTCFFWLLCTESYVSGQVHWPGFSCDDIGIASRPFRLRSKCSICSRRFESRRWSHWGQALSSGFLDIGRDHPSSLGPVPRIVSTLQCRRVRSTPVSFGKREPFFSFKPKM